MTIKLCECGCGKPAPIAKETRHIRRCVKGQPGRFIKGHKAPKLVYAESEPQRAYKERSKMPPAERAKALAQRAEKRSARVAERQAVYLEDARNNGPMIQARREQNRQWHHANRERSNARHRAYQHTNEYQTRKYMRGYHLWRNYGITRAQYEALGNVCAICGALRGAKNRRLHVDHNHGTGRIRGLLCGGCNAALGSFKEDVGLLAKAIAYLDLHRDRTDGPVVSRGKLRPYRKVA